MALAQPSSDELRLVEVRGGLGAVPGIRLAGVAAGIKKRKPDLAVIDLGAPHICAEVITTNEIKAAPLLVSQHHVAKDGDAMRAIVCNSGCANACTGERGLNDARNTARHAASRLGIRPSQVVVASTGVIGVPLLMDRMSKGIDTAVKRLAAGSEAAFDAAEAIMTTDHVPKLSAYAFYENGERRIIGGIAKGSGMISPQMATMLAFVATDAACTRASFQKALVDAADDTFNMISVDGDMSTNDSVYAFARPGTTEASDALRAALRAVCHDLAIAMVRDGEGASKLLTVHVTGAKDEAQARAIARSIINSSLVKTAVHGEDPNWGRVIGAAGSARAGLDDKAWSLYIGGQLWVERGAIEALSEAEAHRMLEEQDVTIRLDLGMGQAQATGWGCDLSSEYVRINAHYRT